MPSITLTDRAEIAHHLVYRSEECRRAIGVAEKLLLEQDEPNKEDYRQFASAVRLFAGRLNKLADDAEKLTFT